VLVATNKVIGMIDTTVQSTHLSTEVRGVYQRLKVWFQDIQDLKLVRPTITLDVEDKAVVLYCTDDLWEVVQKWKNVSLKSMGFLEFVKLWKEVKKIMEKENS